MTTLLEIFKDELENEPNLIEQNFKKMESQKYLERCMDILNADKNVSEETRIIMFVEYAKLVFEEKRPRYVQVICKRCGEVNSRVIDK